ncbi:MAG: hypothetical protein ABIG66_02600 [Candidatus Kerfeldbacteria bacterium]
MSSTLRILIIAVAATAVLAIGVGVYWYVTRQPAATNTNTNTNTAVNQNTNTATNTNQNTNTATNTNTNTNAGPVVVDDGSATVLRLARIYTERFGSFSNRNNFENITSLEPFMTDRLQKEMADFITENQKEGVPEEFYGITTTAISTELVSMKENEKAVVRVGTSRVETVGGNDPKTFTQHAKVTFEQVEGNWKVDKYSWE